MPTVTVTISPESAAILQRLESFDQVKISENTAQKLQVIFSRELVSYSGQVVGFGPSKFSSGWIATANGPGLTVRNTSKIAAFIEFKTEPHPIFARPGTHPVQRVSKNGKAFTVDMPYMLAWVPGRGAFSAVSASTAKANANWQFAMSVQHPGTPGKYLFLEFMDNAGGDMINTALEEEISAYLGAE